jgi:hypothetical protein
MRAAYVAARSVEAFMMRFGLVIVRSSTVSASHPAERRIDEQEKKVWIDSADRLESESYHFNEG